MLFKTCFFKHLGTCLFIPSQMLTFQESGKSDFFAYFFSPRFVEPENYGKHVSPYCGDPSIFLKKITYIIG